MKTLWIVLLGLLTLTLATATFFSATRGSMTYVVAVVADSVVPSNDSAADSKAIVEQCREILQKRCDFIGLKRATVTLYDSSHTNDIRIEIQDTLNSERLKSLFTKSINVAFWEMYEAEEMGLCLESADEKLHEILMSDEKYKHINLSYTEDPDGFDRQMDKPLFSILSLQDPNLSNTVLAQVSLKDTGLFSRCMDIPEVRAEFPRDLRFMWGTPSQIGDQNDEYVALYAIKMPENEKATISMGDIEDASYLTNSMGLPSIGLKMNKAGTEAWAQLTLNNIGRPIALTLNDYVYSTPTVVSEITGGASEISGNFNKEEAQDIVSMIKSGPLPTRIEVMQEVIEPSDHLNYNRYFMGGTVVCGLAFVFMLIVAIKK